MQLSIIQGHLNKLSEPKLKEMRKLHSDSKHISKREVDDKVSETTRRLNYIYGYTEAIEDMLSWIGGHHYGKLQQGDTFG